MIIGIGVDIVDIGRVRRMLDEHGDRILRRLCTRAEIEYVQDRANEAQHVAVRVAAKEAAFKALAGTAEASTIGWSEIEVVPADGGPPRLAFHGRAQQRAEELGVARTWLSLSHGDGSAVAMVVLEGR
jgi:holo-[acyl-carrier protein] synthase